VADQWEVFWVLDRFHCEIDVEVRPMQTVGMQKLHVQQFPDRNVPEPRKFIEWQEELPASKQKPESMLRDAGYLNLRNALSKLYGSHLRVPDSGGVPC